MLTAQLLEEKIVLRIREMVPADKRLEDVDALHTCRVGDLPLDSLDLLTLAMKLEDDIGHPIEMDVIDESLTISELAQALYSLAK